MLTLWWSWRLYQNACYFLVNGSTLIFYSIWNLSEAIRWSHFHCIIRLPSVRFFLFSTCQKLSRIFREKAPPHSHAGVKSTGNAALPCSTFLPDGFNKMWDLLIYFITSKPKHQWKHLSILFCNISPKIQFSFKSKIFVT